MIAVVRVNSAHTHTTPKIAEHVRADFPDVERHACVNALGPAFAHVMEHTSLPHLLEHLTIDIQASEYTLMYADGQPHPHMLKGVTQWIDKDEGLARVQVNMVSDICAISALTRAVDYINSL